MKIRMIAILSLILGMSYEVAIAMEAGFQLESLFDKERDRPILIDWWYPTEGQPASYYNYGLGSGYVVEAGEITKGTYPLVVLSHGAFGAARNYSWIAENLARRGYLVAGISHYGESYVYGEDTIDPMSVVQYGDRPLDISFALSHISDRQSLFGKSIELDRFAFIGHSSGGATAMDLAGLRYNELKMSMYCASEASKGDLGCAYGGSPTKILAETNEFHGENYADSRFDVFIALDPALGPGFETFRGVNSNQKLLIVGSVENDFLPFEYHAKRLADLLPNARTHWLNQGEGHFVYLNECESELKANGLLLCVDREGVSRSKAHKTLNDIIQKFLENSF